MGQVRVPFALHRHMFMCGRCFERKKKENRKEKKLLLFFFLNVQTDGAKIVTSGIVIRLALRGKLGPRVYNNSTELGQSKPPLSC